MPASVAQRLRAAFSEPEGIDTADDAADGTRALVVRRLDQPGTQLTQPFVTLGDLEQAVDLLAQVVPPTLNYEWSVETDRPWHGGRPGRPVDTTAGAPEGAPPSLDER